MTTHDMDAQALLLDQTCFALDAEAFDTFQGLVDNPPVARTAYAARSQAYRRRMHPP